MKQSTRPILDLQYPAWTRTFGDITVIGSWTLDTDRPCIVLMPTFVRPDATRITPCAIRLEDAHLWAPETGSPEVTAHRCAAYAQALGFSQHNPSTLMRIHSIIESCLSDLLKMPNLIRHNTGEAVADVIARDEDGKTIHEGTVYDV